MNLVKTFSTLAFVACTASSFAQGLLSLRPQKDEFEKRMPITYSVSAGMGYDSNTNLTHDNQQDSAYANFGLGARYAGGDRQTQYSLDASYGGFYYLDAPSTQDDYMQNARVGASISHKISPRLSISDNLYAAYEFEPNYGLGAGTTRRSDPYTYYFNNLSVAYAWTRKLSTVTGYTISGIDYSDSGGETFLTQTFNQEFRYQLGKATTGVLEYRFATASYDNNFGDYSSNYFLVGVDHSITRRLYSSFRAGAELRDRENGGNETSPYVEGVLTYKVGKETTVSSYVRYGFDDTSIGSYGTRKSLRIGASASQQINERLSAALGANYVHDTFDDSEFVDGYNEDVVALNASLEYSLYKNISLYTGYSFTTSTSGNNSRDYNRHNVNLGLRAQF